MSAIQSKHFAKQVIAASMLVALLFMASANAQKNQAQKAERAWEPFFNGFLAAVKKRDRATLRLMMAEDIFFSGGGGDDNHDGDMRDDAFKFWDETRAWKAIEKTLRKGTVPMALWWNDGNSHKYPSRVAPPIANRKGNRGYSHYVIFEFREDGKWYCKVLNGCCD